MVYSYGYITNRINDANGNKISSITIGGRVGPPVTVSIDADLHAYALVPAILWASNKKVFGARYGAYFTQPLADASINGTLSSVLGAARIAGSTDFSMGDTFVQPVWLGWTGKRYDISYGYGFYIPSGKYHTTTVTLPVVGPATAEAPDNIGYGFWTNQNQGALYLYPWPDRRMAIQNMLTWEIHRKKRGFDLTPGQNLTWNWGASRYLPLKKDQSVLLEVGPVGYSSWQVSDDTGSDALNPGMHDYVHAVGVQVGVTSVKRVMALNLHYFKEFSSVDRFQGQSIGLNFSLKF